MAKKKQAPLMPNETVIKRLMPEENIFDKPEYWGRVPVQQHLSNYSRIGGYRPDVGRPDLFANWVKNIAKDQFGMDFGSVLVLGCAAGHDVWNLRLLGFDAYGIDISSFILQEAPAEVAFYLSQGDLRNLGSNMMVSLHAPFDFIVSKDVLEHFEEGELPGILAELSNFGHHQMHIVNTGQYPYQAWDGDVTHKTRQPLVWWENLDPKIVFKET